MNNREAFEAWAEKELLPLDRRDSEHYRYNLTNRAWAGWKAGLASQAAELSSNPLQLPAQKQQDHIPDGGEMVQSQAQQTESQWISVEERLPEGYKPVLVATNFGDVYTCRLPVIIAKNSKEESPEYKRERFTHWMPLPPAPEGEKP